MAACRQGEGTEREEKLMPLVYWQHMWVMSIPAGGMQKHLLIKVREKSKYTALVEEEDEVGAKQFCEVSGKSSTLLNCSGMYCECYSIINFSYGICIVQGVTVDTNEAAGPAEGNVQWKEECCSC